MCGICGKISVNGDVNKELIRKMCGALTHRGPDSEGVYINPSPQPSPLKGRGGAAVGLGHRRLAIIDLSPAGHQPMSNEDESVWIVLNGEIYNFLEIKGAKLKYILKKSLSMALPKEILSRGKMGFDVPLDAWFRGELKGYSYGILMNYKSINRDYFKRESVKKLLDEHVAARANNGSRIWSLLFLELWHREFID